MKLLKDLGMVEYGTQGLKTRRGIYECPNCLSEVNTQASHVKSGKSTQCRSCQVTAKNTIHGCTGTKLYYVWTNIKDRCYNKKAKSYRFYGEVGVTMCDEWLEDFSAFKDWSEANGYADKMECDKDVLCEKLGISPKIYSPNTCLWISRLENNREALTRADIKRRKLS